MKRNLKGGKGSPSSLTLLLFEIIWNAENKNNEFNNPYYKKHSILFNLIVKAFCLQPNLET